MTMSPFVSYSFFLNDTAPTEISTLSLHDALPIWVAAVAHLSIAFGVFVGVGFLVGLAINLVIWLRSQITRLDRKSTRLNSSHMSISYAVFCLKKKNAERSLARCSATAYVYDDSSP